MIRILLQWHLIPTPSMFRLANCDNEDCYNLVLDILKESKVGKNEFVESKNNLILQKLVREVEELKSWKKRLEPHKD